MRRSPIFRCFAQDAGVAEVPAQLLLGADDPEVLRERLITAGIRLNLGTEVPDVWDPVLPNASGWLAAFAPTLDLGHCVCSVRTGQ